MGVGWPDLVPSHVPCPACSFSATLVGTFPRHCLHSPAPHLHLTSLSTSSPSPPGEKYSLLKAQGPGDIPVPLFVKAPSPSRKK